MIKHITCLIVILSLWISLLICPVYAAETQENIVYYEDGSYLVTTITEIPSRAGGTKTGSKSGRYYNSNNDLQWLITVTGTFTYDGTTSRCTYVDGTTSIADTGTWALDSENPTMRDATASYSVVLARKALGITIGRENHTISLTCDKNGNLS